MPINTDSAFVRIFVDIPTPVAIKLDEKVKALGVTKKKFVSDALIAAVGDDSTKKQSKK